jgi:hypothetical protein
MRNGLQDYECLWLLQDKIDELKSTFSQRIAELIEPSRRGIEISKQVVETYTEYTRDPDVLYDARRQVIGERDGTWLQQLPMMATTDSAKGQS